jgi:hypothetical protein
MYFSNLAFFLNFFPMTPFINTTLYLGNLAALLGISGLLLLNPSFPYVTFTSMPLSNSAFNAAMIAMHAIPLYLFRARQTLAETFEADVIGALTAVFLVYFAAMYRHIPALYGLSAEKMVVLALFLLFLFLGVHVLFFWK